ncbi:MAG: AAA family ATPase [Lachnospiraceae bacterium]|nr:AAA family ATPase [Lachnospiraceae bacterium]
MTIKKIVITGGPCAGKTTALSWIQNVFTKRGYRVLFVPETATELISGGVAPWTTGTNLDYQKCQVKLQLVKEEIFEQAARTMREDKILIVCDRGALDNRAYMTQEEWDQVMDALNLDEVTLRDGYDAVFHMVTAAKGAVEAYTTANNAARYETVEQAAAMDDKLIAAWTGHPHMRIIDNSTEFQQKLERLVAEITSFLGEPDPFEVERKYLIEYPDTKWLESLPNCTKVEIIQTYLKSTPDVQIRVRQRGIDGHYIYYRTEKRRLSDTRRVEVEERLSMSEYLRQLMEADTSARPIRKTRYCLAENSRYFEIDIYPEWKKQAVLEIELRSEDESFTTPDGIRIIREVTADKRYTNYALAHFMVAEDE